MSANQSNAATSIFIFPLLLLNGIILEYTSIHNTHWHLLLLTGMPLMLLVLYTARKQTPVMDDKRS